jgi:hypothetical protein
MRRRQLSLGGLAALLAWAPLLAWSGCEALIDGKLGVVHCDDEGVIGPPACPDGLECKVGLCTPVDLGVACKSDSGCAANDFCLDLGLVSDRSGKQCSRNCCTSSDCGPSPDFVCSTPPGGVGGFCRLHLEVGRGPTGTAKAFTSCQEDTACRSGRCQEGVCVDTCCSDTSCNGVLGACQFGQPLADDVPSFWCSAPRPDKKPRYSFCQVDGDCASNLCIPIGGERHCSSPCCSSAECGTQGACAPVPVTAGSPVGVPGGDTLVRACTLAKVGPGEVGSICKGDDDCASGFCLPDGDPAAASSPGGGPGRCSDSCCSDEDCGDPSSFGCRPSKISGSWALRCEPK